MTAPAPASALFGNDSLFGAVDSPSSGASLLTAAISAAATPTRPPPLSGISPASDRTQT